LISYGGEQFEVSSSGTYLGIEFIDVLRAYDANNEIPQSTHIFLDRLINALEDDIYPMAVKYFEISEQTRKKFENSPRDRLLHDALWQMTDLFADWAHQLPNYSSGSLLENDSSEANDEIRQQPI
jgi:hypothetical protein